MNDPYTTSQKHNMAGWAVLSLFMVALLGFSLGRTLGAPTPPPPEEKIVTEYVDRDNTDESARNFCKFVQDVNAQQTYDSPFGAKDCVKNVTLILEGNGLKAAANLYKS